VRAGTLVLVCVTSLLGLACDAPNTAEPDAKSADQREADFQGEAQPARAEEEPIRELAELELELSSNETKLRQLGVPITATVLDPAGVDGEFEPNEDVVSPAEPGKAETVGGATRYAPPPKDRGKDKKATGTTTTKQDKAGGAGSAPGTSPSPAPVKPDADASMGGDAARDEAKSIQNPPSDRPTEQSEERCPLICSLADSTCDLTDEICSLADRHPDDDAYSLACDRASNDCKLAREACLECLG
jgi:hypothetical protein